MKEIKGKKINISVLMLINWYEEERESKREEHIDKLYLNPNSQVKICWLLLNPYGDFETLKSACTL